MLYDHGFNPDKVREIDECRTELFYARCESYCGGLASSSHMKVVTPSNLNLLSQYKPFEGEKSIL